MSRPDAPGRTSDKVEPKYGDRTLAKFAKAVGKSACTLARQRSVYRAWQGKEAPGPVSYAVLRELQSHPDRKAIVKKKPEMTKRKAQEIMLALNGKQQKGKSRDWKAEGNNRWLRRVCSFANECGRTAEEVMRNKEVMRALREIAEPALATALVSDLEVVLAFAKLLQQHPHPDEHIAKSERKRSRLKEAECEGVPA